MAVEARKLGFGGGGGRDGKFEGFVTRMGRGSATEDDRTALDAFLVQRLRCRIKVRRAAPYDRAWLGATCWNPSRRAISTPDTPSASASNCSAGLKPHLSRTYKVSKDPEFANKVRDVVGLYLNPPTNAVVLSVDEKTQIQALERTQLPLPLRSGRATRHTHDYKRHGVLDLYAALEVATGKVVHQCTERHTAVEFLAFMKKVVRAFPRRELHVILDNSSSHSTPAVKEWLAAHPRVKFHYTPTSASWLNQVEGFFGILGKQSLHLVDMPSKAALRRHIEAYLESWNANPTAFEWTKPAAALIRSHKRMLDRISGAVH